MDPILNHPTGFTYSVGTALEQTGSQPEPPSEEPQTIKAQETQTLKMKQVYCEGMPVARCLSLNKDLLVL